MYEGLRFRVEVSGIRGCGLRVRVQVSKVRG